MIQKPKVRTKCCFSKHDFSYCFVYEIPTKRLFIHSFIFKSCFFLIRIVVNLEPTPGTLGTEQEWKRSPSKPLLFKIPIINSIKDYCISLDQEFSHYTIIQWQKKKMLHLKVWMTFSFARSSVSLWYNTTSCFYPAAMFNFRSESVCTHEDGALHQMVLSRKPVNTKTIDILILNTWHSMQLYRNNTCWSGLETTAQKCIMFYVHITWWSEVCAIVMFQQLQCVVC